MLPPPLVLNTASTYVRIWSPLCHTWIHLNRTIGQLKQTQHSNTSPSFILALFLLLSPQWTFHRMHPPLSSRRMWHDLMIQCKHDIQAHPFWKPPQNTEAYILRSKVWNERQPMRHPPHVILQSKNIENTTFTIYFIIGTVSRHRMVETPIFRIDFLDTSCATLDSSQQKLQVVKHFAVKQIAQILPTLLFSYFLRESTHCIWPRSYTWSAGIPTPDGNIKSTVVFFLCQHIVIQNQSS